MSAKSKLVAARTSLVLESPFFGSLALHLELREDSTCQTAWTDGRVLAFNPAFIETLSHDVCTALVAHEVMHCAAGHPWRRDGRGMTPWNMACDMAINHELREAGFKLPEGVFYPKSGEEGKSAEWYYARLGENPGQQSGKSGQQQAGTGGSNGQQQKQGGKGQQQSNSASQGQSNAQGTPQDGASGDGQPDPLGEVRDAPTQPDEGGAPAPSEQDWKERTTMAATQAKMMGNLPVGMNRFMEVAMRPRVDLRSLLLRFFSERTNSDYSWTRPNTRYISHGIYLPALHSHEMGEVAIMVDTSGSVDATSLQYARGIIESVIDECSPAGVTVIYADAAVCGVDHFGKGEPLEWKPKGGGGTNFRPALEAIEKDGTAVCAICITDLYGTFPEVPPPYPVLWLSTTENKTAPFGDTVYVDR